jgi:hypothetical protein
MAENQKMEIDLGEDVAQGNYINLAIIAHSVSEFIIDFATVLPGVPKAKVKSRVILTPEHAKRLLLSLQENITRLRSAILPAIFRWAEVPRSERLKVRYFRSAGAGRAVVLPKP